ncbi:hypothetical protein OSTOST_21055 [Ostertagia ostertagi]
MFALTALSILLLCGSVESAYKICLDTPEEVEEVVAEFWSTVLAKYGSNPTKRSAIPEQMQELLPLFESQPEMEGVHVLSKNEIWMQLQAR